MAMKGLFLGHLEKKEEGYEAARQAIKLNFRSHVCWHVLGLLYREDRNYEEALKCYKTALRWDPQNGQVLRDLAVLQVHTGHYEGLVETRMVLLKMNPAVKSSWLALAVAYHLIGKYGEACQTIEQYLDNLTDATGLMRTTVFDNEIGQVHLYKSMVLEEAGDHEACLAHLEHLDLRAGDVLAYRTRKARMLLKTGSLAGAKALYRQLLLIVPESQEYLEGLQASSEVDLEDEAAVVAFLQELKERHAGSRIVKRHYLERLTGDNFEAAFKDYCVPLIKKGAPSVFPSVRKLYEAAGLSTAILGVMDGLVQTFSNLDDRQGQFWCFYFLAQHFELLGETKKAVQYLDQAYALDAAVPDLFVLYASVLAGGGQPAAAVACAEHARTMDLGDRFLNAASVKHILRSGDFKRGLDTFRLFVKEGPLEKQLEDMAYVQAIWFDLEAGQCLMRGGEPAAALAHFSRITAYFDDFADDQLDFHNYALRKMNLTHYIEMLRYETVVYREAAFRTAAEHHIDCILALDKAAARKDVLEAGLSGLALTDSKASVDRAVYLVEKLEHFHPLSKHTQELSFELAVLQRKWAKAVGALLALGQLGAPTGEKRQQLEALLQTGTEEEEEADAAKASLARADFKHGQNSLPEHVVLHQVIDPADFASSPFLAHLLKVE